MSETERETCPTCKFPVRIETYGSNYSERVCSEFCAQATGQELDEFKAAKPGDYCVYPCPECGGPTEGDWYPNEPKQTVCHTCSPKVRLRDRTKLLVEAMSYVPEDLKVRIEEAIKS